MRIATKPGELIYHHGGSNNLVKNNSHSPFSDTYLYDSSYCCHLGILKPNITTGGQMCTIR